MVKSIQNQVSSAATSVKELFVATNPKTKKVEWNGRNIAILAGTALFAFKAVQLRSINPLSIGREFKNDLIGGVLEKIGLCSKLMCGEGGESREFANLYGFCKYYNKY